MATTTGGTTYVTSTDLVADYPTASLALANRVDVVASGSIQYNTATYTATVADILAGKTIIQNAAGATTVNLPSASLVDGMQLRIVNVGAGTVTVATGTLIGTTTISQYGTITATYRTAITSWYLIPTGPAVTPGSGTAVKTDTYSQTSATFTDVTGLSVAITPKATASKVLVIVSLGAVDASTADFVNFRLMRDSTAIGVATSASNRVAATSNHTPAASNRPSAVILSVLDSPASAVSVTYKVQAQSPASTLYLNRTASDTDSTAFPRTASTITVLEVI